MASLFPAALLYIPCWCVDRLKADRGGIYPTPMYMLATLLLRLVPGTLIGKGQKFLLRESSTSDEFHLSLQV